jgi:hypothetical protein
VGPGGLVSVQRSQPSSSSRGQSSIDDYIEAPSAEAVFELEIFRGYLVRLFTTEQLALSKINSPAFRDLLVYLQPRCKTSIPDRTTLKRYIASTYDHILTAAEQELQQANTRTNLSFDLWTSPGRRLSLLGVVAHYIDRCNSPRSILLAMPRMKGSHIATSLSIQLSRLIEHSSLETRFGYTITDNASGNHACMKLLAMKLGINAEHRYVLCMGHMINLVAHEVLFGSDIEAFELELESTVTTELVELATWRKKGPIGKLHNLIRYITHSSNRRDLFIEIQQRQLDEQQEQPYSQLRKHELIRDKPHAVELVV